MPQIVHKRPSSCSKAEITTFETLVKKGEEVPGQGLHERILRAEWLVFAVEEDGTFSGISALKKPNASYKKRVFRKAGTPLNPDDFSFEAGWLFVEPAYRNRKYSRLLLDAVIGLAGTNNVYATTRGNNKWMRRTNGHCGLVDTGSPYLSEEDDYKLVLSVHQAERSRPAIRPSSGD